MTRISVVAGWVRRWWPTVDRTVRGYEPVMLTVAAVLAAALWLPSFGEGGSGELARPAVAEVPAAAPAGQAEAAPPPGSPDGPALASPTITGSPAPPAPAARPDAGAAAPAPAPPAPPEPDAVPVPPAPAPPASGEVPLSVRGAGWASTLGATLPGPVGVPEGAFPVGNRLGQLDAASFVRLSGDGTASLVLQEDLDERRALLGELEVAACAITDPTWPEEAGQRLDEAPTWDAERCAMGTVDDLGRWTFDLGGLGVDPTGEAGFALVPGPDAPVDFQISYRFAL